VSGWIVFNPLPAQPKFTLTLNGPYNDQGLTAQTVTFTIDATALVPK
jgi:hypothetical protein